MPKKSDKKLVEDKVKKEAEKYSKDGDDVKPAAPSNLVRQCLRTSQLGDGILYATLLKDKYIFNSTSGYWFMWSGNSWVMDIHNKHLVDVEKVVDRYLEETEKLASEANRAEKDRKEVIKKNLEKIRKDIFARVFDLRSDTRRNACVKFARTNKYALVIKSDDFDLHPMLLACANGVINLRTGECQSGQPGDYISLTSPTEWRGLKEPCPQWEKTILEIFDGDQDLVDYIQRLLGYGISGLNIEHIFPVLCGQGRNGKSLIVDIISHVLGPLAGPIQSEMLLAQRMTKSASGPSPDIMTLKGLRLAFASESDEGRRFSPSRVKWLTGGDELIGRNPHDKYEVRFTPTHFLMLLTNIKPYAPADDFAFWERLHLIPFKLSFVDRDPVAPNECRAIKDLADKIKEESSGILAWLVKGCLLYQKNGLAPPECVLEEIKQYRRDQDLLADFLEDKCIVAEHQKVQSSKIYDIFSTWFEKNISKKGLSQKKFGTLMSKKFDKAKSIGVFYYYGLDILPDEK